MSAGNVYVRTLVIEAAHKAYASIHKNRQFLVEAELDRYRKPRKKYRLFGPTMTPTREDALKSAQNDRWGLNLYYAESYGLDTELALLRIISAANACGLVYFNLTKDEFVAIVSFYDKGE